ncbi:MAG: thiamine pyrophosphate-binding protein [Syntrophorhabdaceae bacterium]|nr:thiamine pyrophosphate-binding protein [Syntrophorhabdaceae bacterium]
MLCKDLIIKFFKDKNINDFFYLPGIHTISLNESFKRFNIKVYMGRHESNLIFMADGYSRRTGKPGVIFVTPGPGLGNIVSGCMEAYGDNVPVIVFHIDTKRQEHGKGILHELKDPENIFRTITKKTFYIEKIEEVLPVLNEAYETATHERKGPVIISIPFVLLDKEILEGFLSSLKKDLKTEGAENEVSLVDDEIVERIYEIFKDKHMPAIIAGKSLMCEEARPLIDSICRTSSIPFFTTTGGKGIVEESMPYAFGNVIKKGITHKMIKNADIVLAIGTRLRDVDAKRRGVKIRDLIHIDIDETWFNKNYKTLYAASGNLLNILKGLKEIFKKRRFQWDLHALKREQIKEEVDLWKNNIGYKLIKMIRDSIPYETVTVWDLNLISYWAEYYFPVYEQRSFIMPRGISPIFYGLPAGIGVKIGSEVIPCLTVCGDGGILPNLSELSLIKKHNIPICILIYNNNSFGILEDALEKRYSIKTSMQLTNPDFVKLAHAFGIKGKRIKTIEGLKKALLKIDWSEPFLMEFEHPIFSPPWEI